MAFLSLTDSDRAEMLAAIGVGSIEELLEQIPQGVRLGRGLHLEPAPSEAELMPHLEELAGRNVHTGAELSFLGAGIYDHYVPAVVDAILSRGEFLTAYTPYQPEMSQGVLQSIFEYQTAICELAGMDGSNASGYDGPTVAADACFIARHTTGRTKVVLAEALNPQVRRVVKTYAPGFGLEVVEVPHTDGTTDPDRLAAPAPHRRGGGRRAGGAGARSRSPTSTCSRSACSRRRAPTAARLRSARVRAPARSCRTAARTSASSPRGARSSGAWRGG